MSNKLNKKEQVLNQLAEKVKKGELSENMDWRWGYNEYICFTDWLNYVRTGKGGNVAWNWNERADTTWTLTTTNCQTNNCQYGIKDVWIDSFLVYAFPHVGCQVKNDNANKQYQDVNNPHIHRDGGEVPPPCLPIENDNKEQSNKNDIMSTTNLAKEIQKLIQHIEAEYQKGVDYKAINLSKPKETGIEHIIQILSPQLKKACRQKFNFPSNANYHLDYEEGDQEGNDFFYRLGINKNDYDFLSYGGKNLYRSNGIEEPKKCKSCEELTLYENGRIVEWDGEKTGNEPSPNVIGHFHVECAKKYFGDKEQPIKSNNNSPIKDKNPSQSPTNSPNLEKDLIKLLLQYFQERNIKLIKLDNNELVIVYNDGQLVKKPNNSQELQKVSNYFSKTNKQELTKEELSRLNSTVNTNNNTQEPKNNNALLIVGGIGILTVGLIVGLLISRRNKKSK